MPQERMLTVTGEEEGIRADRYLAGHLPELSRSYIQQLISDGRVTSGGRKIKASRPVAAGEMLHLLIPDPVVPDIRPEPMELHILYEDEDILIVDKPKGLTVHPAPGHWSGTLVNGLLAHCGSELSGINGVLRPGIVHRIDMNTSGVLVVCKTDSAHRCIAEQLRVHSITRLYRGVVIGNLPDDEGTVTGAIGRSPKDRKKMAVVREGGKPAVTHYRVLERFGSYTSCEFRLETGRTHQIRVHMASIGHPLLGDDVYGPSRCPFRLNGQTLHAMVLGFRHPRTGQYMEWTAPLPPYFAELLETLRSQSSS